MLAQRYCPKSCLPSLVFATLSQTISQTALPSLHLYYWIPITNHFPSCPSISSLLPLASYAKIFPKLSFHLFTSTIGFLSQNLSQAALPSLHLHHWHAIIKPSTKCSSFSSSPQFELYHKILAKTALQCLHSISAIDSRSQNLSQKTALLSIPPPFYTYHKSFLKMLLLSFHLRHWLTYHKTYHRLPFHFFTSTIGMLSQNLTETALRSLHLQKSCLITVFFQNCPSIALPPHVTSNHKRAPGVCNLIFM